MIHDVVHDAGACGPRSRTRDARARVLVVDDSKPVCDLLEAVLSRGGYQVAACTSATDALRAVRNEHYDVMLLDLRMPGMDGAALLAELRPVSPRPCVVVMTSDLDSDLVDRSLEEGASLCLAKPLSVRALLEIIEDSVGTPDRDPRPSAHEAGRGARGPQP